MTADDRAAAVADALERVRAYLNALDGFYGDDWQDDMIDSAAGDGAAGLYLSDLRALALDAQPGDDGQAGGLTDDERESLQRVYAGWSTMPSDLIPAVEGILAARAVAAPGADTVQALDEVRHLFGTYFAADFGGYDWRGGDETVQEFLRRLGVVLRNAEVRTATGTTDAPTPSADQGTCGCPGYAWVQHPGPHREGCPLRNAARAES